LRLGLAGGGTDRSPYCDEFGGAVLNATIDRYAYAFIEPSGDWHVHFIASDLGVEESFFHDPQLLRTARLPIHSGVYRRMMTDFNGGQMRPLGITSYVDAPAGSGFGSSSALVVALVEAFRALLGLPLGIYDVAHLAFEIEGIDLGLVGGKQDHYATAFWSAPLRVDRLSDRI
jgi:D-glycero-alpha-D-manno-heptose-7-phosphate kinase